MSYTPTNPGAIAMQKLRRMLALSSTFQTVTGEDYAGCLDLIGYVESEASPPRAYVTLVDGSYQQIAGGDASYSRPSINLQMSVEIAPDETLNNTEDERLKAFDQLWGIIGDVMSLSGVDDSTASDSHLNILSATVAAMDEVPKELQGSFGRYFFADVLVSVGD